MNKSHLKEMKEIMELITLQQKIQNYLILIEDSNTYLRKLTLRMTLKLNQYILTFI